MKKAKIIKLLPAYILLPLLLDTNTARSNRQASIKQSKVIETDTTTILALPIIPVMLNTAKLRADYLARHYWDNVNSTNNNHVHHPEMTEQDWADFIDILRLVPAFTADIALETLPIQAEKEKKCYIYLTSLADRYLYDPSSPMRNEELYTSVLDIILKFSVLDNTEKVRLKTYRSLAQKNRIDTKVLGFTYTPADGKQGTLYTLKAPYTLLFTNNPGYHVYNETTKALKQSPTISQTVAQHEVKVLSLYPDVDLAEWRKHFSDFPSDWTNGYDRKQMTDQKNLYDLRTIPTLYLLDKDRTILLRDVTAEEVEEYL